jgi:hypothetical protein
MRAKTGDRLAPWMWDARWTIERYAPNSYPRFLAARQQKERFDFTWLNVVHVPVFVLSTAALPVLVWLAGTRGRRPVACLILVVLFALLGNAAICGIFASPHHRYQSRLAPLAPLVITIVVLGWRRDRVAPTPATPRCTDRRLGAADERQPGRLACAVAARVFAEQCEERLLEVAGGDAFEVKNRDQHLEALDRRA